MDHITDPAVTTASEASAVDLPEMFRRIQRGLILIVALTLLGFAVGAVLGLVSANRQDVTTAMRIVYAFPGFERGLYPNNAKFQLDDVRAPDVINETLRKLSLDLGNNLGSQLRGAITISGFVSPAVVKERDRLRAGGQNPPPYFPDEYEICLILPRDHPLGLRQRELFLSELVNVYGEKFRRTYVELPPQFGSAFEALKTADFFEYELILTREIQGLNAYLTEQAAKAGAFRSAATQLTFNDLLRRTEIFTQVRLNNILGSIYINGLSRDRQFALVKLDYFLRTLEDQEQRLREEEQVVLQLLEKTQERGQRYVLAVKDQPAAARNQSPVVDQALLDSLLANDANNFLVRRALDAGLALRRVQAEKSQIFERKRRMESFVQGKAGDQAALLTSTQTALAEVETSYRELLNQTRLTLDDWVKQQYADAVRISLQPRTPSPWTTGLWGSIVGTAIALCLGLGLSLLRPSGNRVA